MKLFISILLLLSRVTFAQVTFNEKIQGTMLAKLKTGDSLIYYQCRAVNADVQVTTGSQKIESNKQQVSITEKFVIVRKDSVYSIAYYTSGLTVFPNRKFSGLKIRQRAYWNFTYRNKRVLETKELEFLAYLQSVGRETTEYDFAITKHTTNQIIIKKRKEFEQLLIKQALSISETLKL